MKKFMRKNWITALGVVLGTLGGFVYHHFWGCANGCPIKSNLPMMLLYGALMGGLLFNILQGEILKRKTD